MLYYESRYNYITKILDNGFCIYYISEQEGTKLLNLKGTFANTKKIKLVRMITENYCLFVVDIFTNNSSITPNITKGDMVLFMNLETGKVEEHFALQYDILNVLLVENYILLVTKNKIFIYYLDNNNSLNKLDNLEFKKTINTIDNTLGLASARIVSNNLLIATLGKKSGQILLCNLNKKSNKYIDAHNHDITNIELNNNGSLVCTTSNMGTLINIFDTNILNREYQFRRGSFNAQIYNISFSNDSKYIALCSSNNTVHIFYLHLKSENIKNNTSSFNILSSLINICGSEWAYKIFKIPETKTITNCYFGNDNILHILTKDNYHCVMSIEKDTEIQLIYNFD